MKIAKYLLLIALFASPIREICAFETDDFNIYLEIRQTKAAKPPYFLGKNLVLSFSSEQQIRFVGAGFAHENFSRIHRFVKNENNVFMLIYPLPENKELDELRYRLVVDSLWMPDPENDKSVADANGLKLSSVSVPRRFTRVTTSPFVLTDGRVKFIYRGPPNRNVYLVGDFNNWDPFMHKMRKNEKGVYEITVWLTPGNHYYYFLSNGIRVLDPLNQDRGADFEGNIVSRFTYPSKDSTAKLQE